MMHTFEKLTFELKMDSQGTSHFQDSWTGMGFYGIITILKFR
jgi:hypothetical protein